MVWPKRKIQLVASSGAFGIEGVRALLEGSHLEFSEVNSTIEDLSDGFTESWLEKPFSSAFDVSPATELVVWPEVTEHDLWRKKALAQGLPQQSVESLIHNILDDELILQVPEPAVFVEGCPLLGHVLNQAGFEPTILWPTADGKWHCERKQGLHWILPESWLAGLVEDSLVGRGTGRVEEKATWVVRETGVDFYRAQERQKFVGHLPRWPEPMEEQAACLTIAQCLDLGVSWLDIRMAVSSVWKSTVMTDNLRWNNDDSRWNAGAGGEKLPVAPIDHMEDWWAR